MTAATRTLVFGLALAFATASTAHATPPRVANFKKQTKARKPGKRLLRLAGLGLLAAAVGLGGCTTMGSHETRLGWELHDFSKPEAQRTAPDSNYHPGGYVIHYGYESKSDMTRPPDFQANSTGVPTHYQHTKVVSPNATSVIIEVPGIQIFGYPKAFFRATAFGTPKAEFLQPGQDPMIPISSDYSIELAK